MKRFTASILALGLAAGIGTASAQSARDYGNYGSPSVDRYGQDAGAYYDYARVVRVDPVIVPGDGSDAYRGRDYPTRDSQRCYREQGTYADGYDRNDGYGGQGTGDDGYRDDGYGSRYGGYGNQPTNAGMNVATVVGGLLGAAVGSQVGGGSARYATAALGTMVGGMAGRQVYENTHRPMRTATVQVCDPVQVDTGYGNDGYRNDGYPGDGYAADGDGDRHADRDDRRVSGYDVTYEYAGRTYTARTSYNPGDRIRVRVDVSPG